MSKLRSCFVSLASAFALVPVAAFSARVEFKEPFAPQSGFVAPIEKPQRDEIGLNGLWQFQPVELPANFREGVDPVPVLPPVTTGGWDKAPLRVPSPWNVNSFADHSGQGGDFRFYPSYPSAWEKIKMGWLQRSFIVPPSWKGRRIHLHFEAAAGDIEVLINNQPVGRHFGIFLPFSIDVTEAITFGQLNVLRLGIRKPSLFDDRRTPFGRRPYQAGSFWGQHIVGIWQDISLLALSPIRVADTFLKPRLDRDTLEVDLTLRNDTNREATVTINADAFAWIPPASPTDPSMIYPGQELAAAPALTLPGAAVKIPPGGVAKITLLAKVHGQLKTWSPSSPNLYGLVVKTIVGHDNVDTAYTRFGWRQTSLSGNQFLLNGQPLVLKGDSWHFMGIPQMSRRYAWAWYTAARAANLNAIRLHAQPFPRFYMELADEMGFLLLDETAVWASDGGPKLDSDAFWQDTENHLSELIVRDRNHPSVFGWSVSNEVHPIVKGVMRNPPGVLEKLNEQYGKWANICRLLDPTRPWISADGEEDGAGHLPTYMIHYGGADSMDRAIKSGKPWGVGEAGNAYYGTPEQVAVAAGNGDCAYESVLGRMEGVAIDSRALLSQQAAHNANYRSVFNLVWYALEPLPFGLEDTTKAPTLTDGVFFSYFQEGQPGVQPERLGPYASTLNPGYDPSLPLFKPWPLFEAIRDAAAEPPVTGKWLKPLPATPAATSTPPAPTSVPAVRLLAGEGGQLANNLHRSGLPSGIFKDSSTVNLLFIDGETPPATGARAEIDRVLQTGGTVFVWGAKPESLASLNALLPSLVELTQRKASSLLPTRDASNNTWADPCIVGLTAADLYFSELRPPEIITHGLAGSLVAESTVLLRAPEVDWLNWNKQAEYAKTGMVLRSEREIKPSGITMIAKKVGTGRLIVTTFPSAPRLAKAEKAVRTILTNLGLPLEQGSASRAVDPNGDLVKALVLGGFAAPTLEDGAKNNIVEFDRAADFRVGKEIDRKPWTLEQIENGLFDFGKMGITPKQNAAAYLSFWVSSPRSLEDLLIEPDLPSVGLEVTADDALQVWLNGKLISEKIRSGPISEGRVTATELKLHQGWNHFLVKVIHGQGAWRFTGRLTCNQTNFLNQLVSSPEKP